MFQILLLTLEVYLDSRSNFKIKRRIESFELIKTVYDRTPNILDMASTHRISTDVCTEIGQAIVGKTNRSQKCK